MKTIELTDREIEMLMSALLNEIQHFEKDLDQPEEAKKLEHIYQKLRFKKRGVQ